MGFRLSLLIDELTRREAELRAKHQIIPKLLLKQELKVKVRIGKVVVAAIYTEYSPSLSAYSFTVLNRPELNFDSPTVSKITNIMEQFEMDEYKEAEGGLLLFSKGELIVDLFAGGFSIVKDYPRIRELADVLVKMYARDQ